MKSLNLFKLKILTICFTQNLHLPRHHLKKTDKRTVGNGSWSLFLAPCPS